MLSPLLNQVMILKHLCSKYLMFWKTVKTCMLFTPYDEFYDFGSFPSVMCVRFVFFFGLYEMFLGFGIIQSINSHTARAQGLSNVGVWVFVGLNGDTCCLSHFILCPDPVIPLFSCFIWFHFCSAMVTITGFVFAVFLSWTSQFLVPFFHWFSVSSFALANKMFALHFFFSLVLFDLNWFLSLKKTIFLFKQ